MDKESMLQAAEEQWMVLSAVSNFDGLVELNAWHWFWLILAESIWPSPPEITAADYCDFTRRM